MKHLTRIDEESDVFDFKDEDNPDPWSSKILVNPNSDFAFQFLRKNSSQIKEVPTVTLDDDDDDDGGADDIRADPLGSPHKASCEESEGFSPMSDIVVEQRSGHTDSNVEHKSSPRCTQTIASIPPENGHVFPMIPESIGCNGSNYFGDFNGNDMVQKNFPSTPVSLPEKNNVATVGEVVHESLGGLEMDVMEAIEVHTDYVTYGDNYFPASLILFSRESIKIKASAFEESETSIFECNLEDIFRIETQWSGLDDVAKVRVQLLKNNSLIAGMTSETSGVEVLEFLVASWSQHQEQIMSLNLRYNAVLNMGLNMQRSKGEAVPLEDSECSSDPYIPNFEESFEEVVYPKGEVDAVSVRKSDVDLLLPDVFVNDTIIDFYITYLKNEIPHERRQNFHFFSSFFFRKLADLDQNPSSISDGKAAFQRVRRWTRKVNIFEKDFIFIPVNYNLHWSLIILCHLGEVANVNDENSDKASKVPCILHMDSIRGSHAGLKDLIQSYLSEEWKERHKDSSVDVASKILNLRFLSLELPQQENFTDCGLFLLHYAELFIEEAPQHFSPFQINNFDNFLKPNWFVPAEASLKRVHIQRLIYKLLKSLSHECASPPTPLAVNKENDNGIEFISEKRMLEKSLNGNSLYSEPLSGMEMGLLDMPMYRPSGCVEQQNHHNDRGTSLGKRGFSMSTIREAENNEHQTHSNLGQTGFREVDQVDEFHVGCSSGNFDLQFQWNLDVSDQADPEDSSCSSESRSCDDSQSSEETKILEYNSETQSADYDKNEIISRTSKDDNVESEEGYASAASDMMETPAEDSQELAEKYGIHEHKHDHESKDPFLSNEPVEAPEEEVSDTERDTSVSLSDEDENVIEDDKLEDDEVVSGNDEVEDDKLEDDEVVSGNDEDDEVVSGNDEDDEVVSGNDEDDEVVSGNDETEDEAEDSPPRPAKKLRVSPSPGDGDV